MAVNKSYSPKSVAVTATQAALTTEPTIRETTRLSKWPLLFLGGIAKNTASAPIVNGAVVVWMGTAVAGSITDADFMTFTDSTGRYGVSITGATKFVVRFYS